jgi:hypothetical protein
MRITDHKLASKLVKHLNLIENYLNSLGLDVSIQKTESKSINGDSIEIGFYTFRYQENNYIFSNENKKLKSFKKTDNKVTPVLSIYLNNKYGEIYINSVFKFKMITDVDYIIEENIVDLIIDFIKSGINLKIRKIKWKNL